MRVTCLVVFYGQVILSESFFVSFRNPVCALGSVVRLSLLRVVEDNLNHPTTRFVVV